MKKHILTSLNLFLLCSLFLSTVSIVYADEAISGKMLPKKPGFVAKARKEFQNAQEKHDDCRKRECTEEKKLYEIAWAELNKKGESNEKAVRATHAYDARELCLQQRCAEKYKKMKTAEKKYNRRKIGRAAAIVAAAALATGAAKIIRESEKQDDIETTEKELAQLEEIMMGKGFTGEQKSFLRKIRQALCMKYSSFERRKAAISLLKNERLTPDEITAAYMIYNLKTYKNPQPPNDQERTQFIKTMSIN